MGLYPGGATREHERHANGTETWIEDIVTPGLTRSRIVTAGVWIEHRTDCFCCSCDDELSTMDVFCRNHGFAGSRPCEVHGMPGQPDDDGAMPASVQAARRSA